MTGKIGVTKLNDILLNSMLNIWYRQAHVQGFKCASISLKNSVNMFESIKIDESIYEGMVTLSYKKLLG